MRDVRIEYFNAGGPGGQKRNKTANDVRATHTPTGVEAVARGRNRAQNRIRALKTLRQRLRDRAESQRAAVRKQRRDHAIHNTPTIRTYDLTRGLVIDHRTRKTAPVKSVLEKGNFQLVTP